MPKTEIHFVANVDIKKVVHVIQDEPRYSADPKKPDQKTISTIAHLTVTNSQLDQLSQRIGAHLSLVEDGGDIGDKHSR